MLPLGLGPPRYEDLYADQILSAVESGPPAHLAFFDVEPRGDDWLPGPSPREPQDHGLTAGNLRPPQDIPVGHEDFTKFAEGFNEVVEFIRRTSDSSS